MLTRRALSRFLLAPLALLAPKSESSDPVLRCGKCDRTDWKTSGPWPTYGYPSGENVGRILYKYHEAKDGDLHVHGIDIE